MGAKGSGRTQQRRYDGDPEPFEMGWKVEHPYTKQYLQADGCEIGRCSGCGAVRLHATGWTCKRCSSTCGRLFA